MFLIRWVTSSDPSSSASAGIRFTATVLFPREVKRRLGTIEAATRHALDLARQAVSASLPCAVVDWDRQICTVEVQSDDLPISGEPSLTTDEGTRVWLERTGMD